MAKKAKKGTPRKKKQSKKKVVQVASSNKVRKVSHKGARAKGLQFERDVANAIGHVYPEAKRHLESQADSAQEGRDISNTGPYAIQCKNHQNYCTIKTIKEVARTEENRPVLVTKGNKMEPLVVMYFSDWILMLEEIKGREDYEDKWDEALETQTQIRAIEMVGDMASPPVIVARDSEALRDIDIKPCGLTYTPTSNPFLYDEYRENSEEVEESKTEPEVSGASQFI